MEQQYSYLLITTPDLNNDRIEDRGSSASLCLESAWGALQALIPELPPAVMVILSAAERRKKRGHFARSSWLYRAEQQAHEVGLSPLLFHQPEELLATLLHEAAHALLQQRTGSGGCSGPYYHTRIFRDVCMELGLAAGFLNTRYGWTLTGWPENGIPDRYQPVLRILCSLPTGAGELSVARGRSRSLPASGQECMVCACPRSIYASRSISAAGAILCQLCGQEFHAAAELSGADFTIPVKLSLVSGGKKFSTVR